MLCLRKHIQEADSVGYHVPRMIATTDLHNQAKLRTLAERREIALPNLLHDMSTDVRYICPALVNNRQAHRITFKTNLVQYDIYKRSPYFVGSSLWNNLTNDLQRSDSKIIFKTHQSRTYHYCV